MSRKDKAHQLRSRCIPRAIYAAEAGLLNETVQHRLTTAIKDTLSNPCVHKDANMTFATSSYGHDVDPEVIICTNRVMMVRRMLGKKTGLKKLVDVILQEYHNSDYTGTNVTQVKAGHCDAAPAPGQRSRKGWKPFFSPFGPIGILLFQLHCKAAALGIDYNIHAHGWPPINLLQCPYQVLARHPQACSQRPDKSQHRRTEDQ